MKVVERRKIERVIKVRMSSMTSIPTISRIMSEIIFYEKNHSYYQEKG